MMHIAAHTKDKTKNRIHICRKLVAMPKKIEKADSKIMLLSMLDKNITCRQQPCTEVHKHVSVLHTLMKRRRYTFK